MIKEIGIGGVLLAPILGYALASAVIWLGLRYAMGRLNLYRFVWHPPLFNAAVYVIILSIVVAAAV
jgi:hypothetical protein